MSLALDKAAVRVAARVQRRACATASPGAALQTAALSRAFDLTHGPFGRVETVAVYRPIGAELDPGPLADELEARGCAIVLPVVVRDAAPLAFRLRTGALVPDAVGLAAPADDAGEVRPDLVVAPLLAFDATGARLGQGGGFYDRTLAALRRSGRVFALGLAYAGQEVERAPSDELDQRLDGVLTEAGLRLFGRSG